ncbi:MAG TPA: TIGR00266 family protein [Gemmatimonadaceae bacterium]|nr:TIGR00266 family protein [Gemmatimonadaceae bacterium]
MADEIDYKLIGDDLQAVIITLDPGEMVLAEAGAMMYMQDGIVMNTTLDPNAQGGGLMNKLFQGAKRALSGDTFFVTTFANAANGRQDVAFSSHFPGKIRPVDLRDWGGVIIAQKDAFLVAARGANVTIAFTRRIGAGFFGGEGFILQRIEGDGLAFLHASGTLHEITLRPGESLRVDTGCLVAMEQQVDYDIEMVPGIKTALFGGEGLFFARLRGPGRVLLQTMPFSRLADRILAAAPGRREHRAERYGAAGLIGGVIGTMMDGDR